MRKTSTLLLFCLAFATFRAFAYTETIDGITWTYTVSNGEAAIGDGNRAAIPMTTSGAVIIPRSLGGCPVTKISNSAFYYCDGIMSLTIPDSVTNIGSRAFSNCHSLTSVALGNGVTNLNNDVFYNCKSLKSFSVAYDNPVYKSLSGLLLTKDGNMLVQGVGGDVIIPSGVTSIGPYAFCGRRLSSVSIPAGVTNICAYAFHGCSCLTSVSLPEGLVSIEYWAFAYCQDLVSITIPDSVVSIDIEAFGWSDKLWSSWYRTLANIAAKGIGSSTSATDERVTLVATNIVIHYVRQSAQSDSVIPPLTTGFVNVVTEVGCGNAVAISSEWAGQYPGFVEKFGSDFCEAITKQTGKRDSAGNPMFVWQDFVAGTDPTDETDVFCASITFDAVTGEPIISWTPELSATETAKRIYKTYGKLGG